MITLKQGFGVAIWFVSAAVTPANVTVETYSNTNVSLVTYNWRIAAQTFTAPVDNSVLSSWQFRIDPREGGGSLRFSVHPWSDTEGTGTELYSTTVLWPAAGGDATVSGLSLPLVPGQRYAAVFDMENYREYSVHFGENAYDFGNAVWTDSPDLNSVWTDGPAYDLKFSATFTPIPEPSSATLLIIGCLIATALCRNGDQN